MTNLTKQLLALFFRIRVFTSRTSNDTLNMLQTKKKKKKKKELDNMCLVDIVVIYSFILEPHRIPQFLDVI